MNHYYSSVFNYSSSGGMITIYGTFSVGKGSGPVEA